MGPGAAVTPPLTSQLISETTTRHREEPESAAGGEQPPAGHTPAPGPGVIDVIVFPVIKRRLWDQKSHSSKSSSTFSLTTALSLY